MCNNDKLKPQPQSQTALVSTDVASSYSLSTIDAFSSVRYSYLLFMLTCIFLTPPIQPGVGGLF